jgi:amino acid transporter
MPAAPSVRDVPEQLAAMTERLHRHRVGWQVPRSWSCPQMLYQMRATSDLLGSVERATSRPMGTIVAGLLLAIASLGSVLLLWYLPIPRRWWSLALFVLASYVLPVLSGFVVQSGLRRYLKDRQRRRRPGLDDA